MNFFAHQDAARARSTRLLWLFAAAVAGLVLAVYAVLVVMANLGHDGVPRVWVAEAFWGALLGTTSVIGLAAWLKTKSLGAGGAEIAMGFGGRLLNPSTANPQERRLLNVVEEMAIASGVPVPSVLVLDEDGINAFAAGYAPQDAAIAVTRGALHVLSRDELQGVVAHEFAHILNGDMRLNIRLIGVLFGIMMIGNTGGWIFRHTWATGGYGRRRSGGGGAPWLPLAGLVIWVVGSLGLFAGRLIQRAVSRQREFLADAAAVQFTRDPSGLAGALRKIGGFTHGSAIASRGAAELSHMFFGEATQSMLGGLFATHPPLTERVRRLDPSFDGAFVRVETPASLVSSMIEAESFSGVTAVSPLAESLPQAARYPAGAQVAAPRHGALSGLVGTVVPEQLEASVDLLATVPSSVRDAARVPMSAVALVYALLVDTQPDVADGQLQALRRMTHPHIYRDALQLVAPVRALNERLRLPALELCAPALRQLSPAQRERLFAELDEAVRADGHMSVREYAVVRCLRTWLGGASHAPAQFFAIRAVRDDVSVLLSALARVGHDGEALAAGAFERGVAGVPRLSRADVHFVDTSHCGFDAIDAALVRIRACAPIIKQHIVDAAWRTVAADGQVRTSEYELLRVVCDALGCPVPLRL